MSPVECQSYTNYIPDYAEHELARLHAGRYSSLPHFEIYGLADQASTYVARRDDQTTALLLYRRNGAIVRVLNEGIPLTMDEAQRFADHIFTRRPDTAAVQLRAVEMPPAPGHLLAQRVECEQDSVLTLPASKEEYLRSLGPRTRALLKNRLNKLKREHPGMVFHVTEQGQIDPQHVRAVLALHRARVHNRRGAVQIDAEEENRIIRMTARCGLLGVFIDGGRCCAGAICYRNGDVVSARFLGHDADYDLYRMGFLCAYLTCAECIERRGLRQFNFGWGKEAYKSRLGGQARNLSDVVIYRDLRHRLKLAPLAVGLRLRGWQFQLRRLKNFVKARIY